MENDIHLAAATRVTKHLTMKPQTSYVLSACIKPSPYYLENEDYSFEPSKSGFLKHQPELHIAPALVKLKNWKFPLQLSNTSNKNITIKKGCLMGTLDKISDSNIETKE